MSPRKTSRRRPSTARKPARRTSRSTSRRTQPKRKAAARRRAVRKRVVRKRAVRKRTVRKRAVRKRAVRKRTAPPAFAQRAGASERQIVLFEMMRARAAFQAAIQGLPPAAAGETPRDGGWSVREIVLHLVTRDQARLRELESVLHGTVPSWKGVDDEAMARINADLMKPLLHHDWEESQRLLHRTRQQLLEAVESVPEEPDVVWTESHGFGWMLRALPPHDRHHAEAIKRWRATRGA